MTSAEVFVDAFGRIRDVVHQAVGGLTTDQLAFRTGEQANSIGWLGWHLTRVQDDHIAAAAGQQQVWTDGWAARFGLPFEDTATGYGHTSREVAAVHPSGELLTGYHDAVHERSVAYLERLADDDLTRIVDESWNPPVTLGVRLVSVIGDDLQHAGQAAFIRGLLGS